MPDHGLQFRQRNKLPNAQGGVWHPSWVHSNSRVIPVVGPLWPRPTTGYLLANPVGLTETTKGESHPAVIDGLLSS
jgi:hypothetical protein